MNEQVQTRQPAPEAIALVARRLQMQLDQEKRKSAELEKRLAMYDEILAKAGGMPVIRRRHGDSSAVVSFGKQNRIVGLSDPLLTIAAGEIGRSDLDGTVLVERLGCGSEFARDIAEFECANPDGTIVARINGDPRLYWSAGELLNGRGASLQAGDRIRCDDQSGFAYSVISRVVTRDYTAEIAPMVFASNRDLLARVEKMLIDPLFADADKRAAGNLALLHGPSGAGKSYAVKALCANRGVFLLRITGDQVGSSFVSETGRGIRAKFTEAIERAKDGTRVVILFEEVDSVAARRDDYDRHGEASQEFRNTTETVINNLDRLTDLGPAYPISVAFSTNCLSLVDAAVRSRASEEIEFGFITREYGLELLDAYLSQGQVVLEDAERNAGRLMDILFDMSTPLVRIETRLGPTVESFRLFPGQLMVPRLISNLAGSLKGVDKSVPWADLARAAHSRLLTHASQIADSPRHYVPYVRNHPFANDPAMTITAARPVYPRDLPREFLI